MRKAGYVLVGLVGAALLLFLRFSNRPDLMERIREQLNTPGLWISIGIAIFILLLCGVIRWIWKSR
jgi:hypothetical protein